MLPVDINVIIDDLSKIKISKLSYCHRKCQTNTCKKLWQKN